MKTKVLFTVMAEVTANDPGDCKRKIREVRKGLKMVLDPQYGIKIVSIENKIMVE